MDSVEEREKSCERNDSGNERYHDYERICEVQDWRNRG